MWFFYIIYSLQTPLPLPLCDGGFSEGLYRKDIGQIGFFGEENSEYKSQTKKDDSDSEYFLCGG